MRELDLIEMRAYRSYLEAHPEEWCQLDRLCRISISRFYRDRAVFDRLAEGVLPWLIEAVLRRGERRLSCWSAGCASGEEPYTLRLIWAFCLRRRFSDIDLAVIASDPEANLLRRAERACYPSSSLKELPAEWVREGFSRRGALFCLQPELRDSVRFRLQDIRVSSPTERFELVLCRNLAFTYFDESVQRQVLARLRDRLMPGGVLVIGSHESLPAEPLGFVARESRLGIYERAMGD
jgi:chemotaxis protein methyltransferase CheR